MSVSEHDLLTIGQVVNARRKYVAELESKGNRFTTLGAEELKAARAALRMALREQRRLREQGQMRLLDAPLKEMGGKRK